MTIKTEVFVAVRGGVVLSVRLALTPAPISSPHCYVVDYDNHDGGSAVEPVVEFERRHLDGRTWREVERASAPVWSPL